MPLYQYLYLNRNPNGTTCPECRRRIGRLYAAWERPFLPRHQHCYCYYQRVPVEEPKPAPPVDRPVPEPPWEPGPDEELIPAPSPVWRPRPDPEPPEGTLQPLPSPAPRYVPEPPRQPDPRDELVDVDGKWKPADPGKIPDPRPPRQPDPRDETIDVPGTWGG